MYNLWLYILHSILFYKEERLSYVGNCFGIYQKYAL